MTLRFMDGCTHYGANSDILKKWTTGNGNTIDGTNGRQGDQCIKFTSTSGYITKTLTAKASWIVGFALKGTISYDPANLVVCIDGSTNHAVLYVNPGGTLEIRRNATTIFGPSTKALTTNIWNYIEFKVTIDDAAAINSCEVRVNGETWLKNTGSTLDTRNAGNASANQIRLGGVASGTTYFQDIYMCDGDDATATQHFPNNDFLGDVRIRSRFVGADGNYTGSWTRNGAGVDADYKAVDEVADDNDTTYLSSSTPTQRSSWTMINLADAGTIKAVQTVIDARKDDAGVRTLDTFLRKAGADSDAGDNWALASSYAYYMHIYGAHPDGTHWTPAEVDAIEMGINEVA